MKWLERLREDGAAYLLISEPETFRGEKDFFDYVAQHYAFVDLGDSCLLYDLRKESQVQAA